MTRIVVKKLIWDSKNTEHIKKHGVSVNEAEEAVKNFVTHNRAKHGRYVVIGRSGSRILSVFVNRNSTGTYYPATARDASKKERTKVYEKEKV